MEQLLLEDQRMSTLLQKAKARRALASTLEKILTFILKHAQLETLEHEGIKHQVDYQRGQ